MSTETVEKPRIVFVLGAPGSGKGTQCANIVDKYNYVHLSAGDLLRAERNRPGSELAQTIEEYIQAGRIIPVAVTCSLLERAMNEQMKVSCSDFMVHRVKKLENSAIFKTTQVFFSSKNSSFHLKKLIFP